MSGFFCLYRIVDNCTSLVMRISGVRISLQAQFKINQMKSIFVAIAFIILIIAVITQPWEWVYIPALILFGIPTFYFIIEEIKKSKSN
jgi:hypothetical protein